MILYKGQLVPNACGCGEDWDACNRHAFVQIAEGEHNGELMWVHLRPECIQPDPERKR